mmetsp:Transcript_13495/g.20528  ORF Transcript_13495/g.20528 Transcript_13495/m.20528 type:complete len:116 (-) Transcript_13495:381-728(-)
MSDGSREDFIQRKRKGWNGQDMEISHKLEKMHEPDTFAAIDLTQFRNTKVGEGYQAKHVFRQKTGMERRTRIVDMSGETSKLKKKLSKENKMCKYLQSAGVREFRRQLDKILNST